MTVKNLEIELIQYNMTIISHKKSGGKKELKIKVTSVTCRTIVWSRAKCLRPSNINFMGGLVGGEHRSECGSQDGTGKAQSHWLWKCFCFSYTLPELVYMSTTLAYNRHKAFFFFKLPTIGGSTAGCWNCNFFEDPTQIILLRLLTPLSAQRGKKCESPVLNYFFYSKESLRKIPSALLWGRDIYLQGMIGKNTGKVKMDNWVISWFPPNKPLSF